VLSTGDATKKIKTGQLLRVDGTEGKVYILDKK
jgi:phosphohistidine swiveling domain-containing protein